LDFGIPHQPLHAALADILPLAFQGDPHPPVAVGAVVALMDLLDAAEQALVLDGSSGSLALFVAGELIGVLLLSWNGLGVPFFQVGILVSGSPSNPAWLMRRFADRFTFTEISVGTSFAETPQADPRHPKQGTDRGSP
jgi:hypothetical protein